jgi:glutaredoxin
MRVRIGAALAALGMAAAFFAATAQQLYRWVDKDGGVHYTQQPPPREAAKSVEQRKIGKGSVVESNQVPFALQQAMKNYPVTLYTSPTCKQGCPEAKDLLNKRGVPFREFSVFDPASNEQLKKATGDNKVPTLTVGTVVQKGYEPDAIHSALDTAGYPRTPSFTGKPPALPPLPTPVPAESEPQENAPPQAASPDRQP